MYVLYVSVYMYGFPYTHHIYHMYMQRYIYFIDFLLDFRNPSNEGSVITNIISTYIYSSKHEYNKLSLKQIRRNLKLVVVCGRKG